MIQTHLDARKTEYESYRPDEVKKLDGAAVVKSGDYVAVIIADDTAAAEAAYAPSSASKAASAADDTAAAEAAFEAELGA